jgi:hypothetical protein
MADMVTAADRQLVADWLQRAQTDADIEEVEYRQFLRDEYRSRLNCVGADFVRKDSRYKVRYFWNKKHKKLTGLIHFSQDVEGAPSSGCIAHSHIRSASLPQIHHC